MALKLLILFALLHLTVSRNYRCNEKSVLNLLRRPAYDFSMKILDRASENEQEHFVFSPLSTWLQLAALAEGASGATLHEIWQHTRNHRKKCFKLTFAKMLHGLQKGLKREFKRNSVMVIDELMSVKKSFIHDVKKFYDVEVLLKNFERMEASADEVNEFIDSATDGVISDALYYDDFERSVMLLSDNVYFRTAWKAPFNPAYTKREPFLSKYGIQKGKVNMMNQIGYYNIAHLPQINAKLLEIPCQGGASMIIFLPLKVITRDLVVRNIFFDLQRTTLNSIFNIFRSQGPKLVNVKIPRFSVNTTISNLPELMFDMNIRRVFNAQKSELSHVSGYSPMYASLALQIADIEVTEQGVRASTSVENLVNETVSDTEEFVANRPFAYIIVDRKTQFILFAGAYSVPSAV